MNEWTDEFITHAQGELVAMVEDWKYDYGVSDQSCITMLLWMVLKMKPDAVFDPSLFDNSASR